MKLFSLFASLATFVGADNLVARIGKEAPDFEAEAVVDGDFQKVGDQVFFGTVETANKGRLQLSRNRSN